ncbi:hypothetical protein PHYSODRAFT_410417, partial [Phytophthora sojae]
MLIDTGAIASLVDKKVLKWLGRSAETLRPYTGGLDSVTGHEVQIKGEIDLPVTLGSVEKLLLFASFRAVIDMEAQTMTLKDTGEVIPLGETRVEESYSASVAATVRLEPGSQALVRSRVRGGARQGSVVLVEGLTGGEASLRVARTLCTVHQGQVLVEVCNASTEEMVI